MDVVKTGSEKQIKNPKDNDNEVEESNNEVEKSSEEKRVDIKINTLTPSERDRRGREGNIYCCSSSL